MIVPLCLLETIADQLTMLNYSVLHIQIKIVGIELYLHIMSYTQIACKLPLLLCKLQTRSLKTQ